MTRPVETMQPAIGGDWERTHALSLLLSFGPRKGWSTQIVISPHDHPRFEQQLNASMLNLRNIEPRKRTNTCYQAEVDKGYSANLLWKHIVALLVNLELNRRIL